LHLITSSATLFLRLLSFRLNARERLPHLLLREEIVLVGLSVLDAHERKKHGMS
jgi:hypothetical protein